MKRRSIEVIVEPSGAVQIDAVGFTGPDCEQATAFLEEALGCITHKHRKPEFHQREVRHQNQRLGA